MPFQSVDDVKQYLSDIPKFQSDHQKAADFNLNKFKAFCADIGNPQNKYSTIHVAGTNGKGSTCRILAGIYRRAGFKTALYSSPHILQYNERFEINGQCISDQSLIDFFDQYQEEVEEAGLTYFEISTAIAFWWFAKEKVDLAIIEVGLGGRLDATNIIEPEVSVITSIAMDHTDILGDSLEEVAREKAGIIKPKCPVVIGKLPERAEKEIRATARKREADIWSVDALNPKFTPPNTIHLNVNNESLAFQSTLHAPVQALNVAAAWHVQQILNHKFPVSSAQFRQSLKKINIGYGRFERLLDQKKWYFDGAHNIEALRRVKETVSTVGSVDEAILVLSLMRDKITPQMADEFSEFKNIYYYTLNTKRAAPFKEVQKWLPQARSFPTRKDQQQAFLKEVDSELVIFAGSFYFYATVRDWIQTLV